MQVTKNIPAIERAMSILETLDHSNRGMNIAELSRKLKIPRSSVHVIVLTLERCGYLTRDIAQHNCRLSVKAFQLGREALSCEQLSAAALKPMRVLSVATEFTSHLAILDQDQAIYVQKVQGSSFLRLDTNIGKRTNLHCTAVGKVLLSYAPEQYREKILAHGAFARHTRNTITRTSALREELKKIVSAGYAVDDQEEELDVHCLAVPVLSARGEVIAALSISGVSSQLKDGWVSKGISLLRRAARQIQKEPGLTLRSDVQEQ